MFLSRWACITAILLGGNAGAEFNYLEFFKDGRAMADAPGVSEAFSAGIYGNGPRGIPKFDLIDSFSWFRLDVGSLLQEEIRNENATIKIGFGLRSFLGTPAFRSNQCTRIWRCGGMLKMTAGAVNNLHLIASVPHSSSGSGFLRL